MNIEVKQNKISIGDKYQVFVDKQCAYTAAKSPFLFLAKIKLFGADNTDTPKIIIKKKFFFLKAKYIIERSRDKVYEFRAGDTYFSFFQCQCEFDLYEIYRHDRRKYSIFKNKTQIAWWAKKAVTWFKGDAYNIIADGDCDLEIIISFCLIIDNLAYSGDKNLYSNAPLELVVEEKKFDSFWFPKS